jgi:hypothetical protein
MGALEDAEHLVAIPCFLAQERQGQSICASTLVLFLYARGGPFNCRNCKEISVRCNNLCK